MRLPRKLVSLYRPSTEPLSEEIVSYERKKQLKKTAVRAVSYRVKLGEIPHISTQICVDCGNQAEAYDHRNYYWPMNIEPVCLICNLKRGAGLPYCERDISFAGPKQNSHLGGKIGGLATGPSKRRNVDYSAIARLSHQKRRENKQ